MKHPQQPEVLPRQRLLAQPQSFTPSSQIARPSQQTLPLQPPTIPAAPLSRGDRPSVSQHQDVASGDYSTRPVSSSDPRPFVGSQNTDLGQLGRRTNATDFPGQTANSVDRIQGQRSTGQRIWKRRGRSPRRHGAEKLELAVSLRRLESTLVYMC